LYICTRTSFLESYAYIQQEADQITDVTTPEQAQHVIDDNAFGSPSPNKQSTNLTSPKIGKINMLYGPPNPTYERALQSHLHHSTLHSHPTFILRQQLLPRLWSKPAYILSQLLLELEKSDSSTRLEWLFWFDADTYLLNPHIPLSIFLPPEDHSHIHLLCTNDHNGLNDGAFFARVGPWTVHLMAAALSLEELRPTVSLKYSEQSAIEHLITQEAYYANHTAILPQRWFNAFVGPRDWDGEIKKGKQLEGHGVREGDLLVHFAGRGDTKRERMRRFMNAVERDRGKWEVKVQETEIEGEVREFWRGWSSEGSARVSGAGEVKTEGREEA
jgi:hypothetical protein